MTEAQEYLKELHDLERRVVEIQRAATRWRSPLADLELLYYLETIVEDETELGDPARATLVHNEIKDLFCRIFEAGLEFPERGDDQYQWDLEGVQDLVEKVRR